MAERRRARPRWCSRRSGCVLPPLAPTAAAISGIWNCGEQNSSDQLAVLMGDRVQQLGDGAVSAVSLRCIPGPPSGSAAARRAVSQRLLLGDDLLRRRSSPRPPQAPPRRPGLLFRTRPAGACFDGHIIDSQASIQSPISEPARLLVSIPVQSSGAPSSPRFSGAGESSSGTDLQGNDMKTKAALALGAGKPLVIDDVDLEGPKEGEVMVEIKATGLLPHRLVHAVRRRSGRRLPGDPRS